MVDKRLRSRAYKARSTMAALQNVEPAPRPGFFSRRFDDPDRSFMGLKRVVREREDLKRKEADFDYRAWKHDYPKKGLYEDSRKAVGLFDSKSKKLGEKIKAKDFSVSKVNRSFVDRIKKHDRGSGYGSRKAYFGRYRKKKSVWK